MVARENLESFLGPRFCSILSMERMDSPSMAMIVKQIKRRAEERGSLEEMLMARGQ